MKLKKVRTALEIYRDEDGNVVDCKEIYEDVLMDSPIKSFFKSPAFYINLLSLVGCLFFLYVSKSKFDIILFSSWTTYFTLDILRKFNHALYLKHKYYDN